MGVSKRSNNCGVILLPNNCGRWIVILKKNFCTFAKLTFFKSGLLYCKDQNKNGVDNISYTFDEPPSKDA